MLDQCVFDLDRADPDTPDLEHVVGAAGVPQEAVLVLCVLVAGPYPVALDGVLGLVVLVPVERARRIALYEQIADPASRRGPAVVVQERCFVARDRLARRARSDRARLVRHEDVQDLRRADAVQDGDPEALLEALEHGWR